ncbi:hypothetical protein PS684_01265 [Pseudomonas fluorescens]|nr:hypothetical protein PS681_00372 [Pseudomonas fluorescens]VVN53181.1 hypothetical protein PS684_01265 [Pseudomonas fluorescens]
MGRQNVIEIFAKTNFSAARKGRRFVLCLPLETL